MYAMFSDFAIKHGTSSMERMFSVALIISFFAFYRQIRLSTVFPRINARGVYFKIRDFRGRSFEGAFIRGGAFISKFQK